MNQTITSSYIPGGPLPHHLLGIQSEAGAHDISHEIGSRLAISSRIYQTHNPNTFVESADKAAAKKMQYLGMARTTNHFNITNKLAGAPLQVHLSSEKKAVVKSSTDTTTNNFIGHLKQRTMQF